MKAFYKFFLVSFFLLPCFGFGQSNWLWARSAPCNSNGEGTSVSTDPAGNLFVAGAFYGTSITFGSHILTNFGASNVFIAKYDSVGNVLWAKSAVGTSIDYCYSVCSDAEGNAFITGFFYGDSITFDSIKLTNAGVMGEVFIAKYDPSGNVLWAKSGTGISDDVGYSVCADANGNAFVTGSFQSPTLTFDSTIITHSTSSGNNTDLFIVKFNPSGNVVWAKGAGGSSADIGYGVSADTAGNVFVTGFFASPSITFGSTVLTNAGVANVLISKFDANGNVLWAKSAGGTSSDMGNSLSADNVGNVFVTGYFQSPTITFGNIILTNVGIQNVFIVKYDRNGNIQWAKSAAGASYENGYSISANNSGNIFVTGSFSGSITFASTTLTPPANSADPIFIVKYDSLGILLCASTLASGGDDQDGVSADRIGNAYVAGDFEVNPFVVGEDTLLLTGGNEEVFVAKYNANCNLIESIHDASSSLSSINIFPNPSNGKFTIQNNFTGNCEMEIYNSLGEKIVQSEIRSRDVGTKSEIDLSDQPNGIYFAEIKTEKEMFTQKIIIQK